MRRPRVFDSFMFHDEIDVLLCRLTEIYDAVDGVIVIEADVTHQDARKPSYLRDNWTQFSDFHDKIVPVWATGLPTVQEDSDPWAREHRQREWTRVGLEQVDAAPDDVVLHGDVDEIPTAVAARNVRPSGYTAFEQRGHFWAVDWLYPPIWRGTVAARCGAVKSFGAMRDARNICPHALPDAGWHLSWLGGPDVAQRKVKAFCHPEVEERIVDGLDRDVFYLKGIHVDGVHMVPVDVDETWPKWIVQGNAPASWYRPRD